MKLTLLLATGGALCAVAGIAHATPAPKLAPAKVCAPDANSEMAKTFNRLPDYVFRYFGSMERYKLLIDDFMVFDQKNGYINISYGENRSNHPDRDQLLDWEMRVFRDTQGKRVIVVASSVKSQTKILPFLHVFRFNSKNELVRTTAKDFPYPLYFEKEEGGGKMPYDYILKSNDNIVRSALPQSDLGGYAYRWTGKRFVRFIETGGHD